MWRRGIVALFVAGASLPVPCEAVVPPALRRADLNGDRQINVLDVQACVAALLAPGVSIAEADITGDGVTDVRDLQRLIGQASDQKEPAEVHSRMRELAATIPDTVRLAAAGKWSASLAVAALPAYGALRHGSISEPPLERLCEGKLERYLRESAVHSPPAGWDAV